jgi:hypothetical protein
LWQGERTGAIEDLDESVQIRGQQSYTGGVGIKGRRLVEESSVLYCDQLTVASDVDPRRSREPLGANTIDQSINDHETLIK